MKPALRLLTLVSLLFLTACFKSEEQKAIDLVKTGYLDQDKSAPVGKILEGYSFFARTEWEVFETKQGKKIVEFRGYSPLAENLPERIAAIRKESSQNIARSGGNDIFGIIGAGMTLDRLAKPEFAEAAAALDLTAVFRAQFALLPEDRFEVSYVGQGLRTKPNPWPQPDGTDGPASNIVEQILAKSERGNSALLDQLYADRILPFPNEALILVNEYWRLKKGQ